MKTPKVSKSSGKEKFSGVKGGVDKKSIGKGSKKKFNNSLSIIKNAHQAHSFIVENADKIHIKTKKKGKPSPEGNIISPDTDKKKPMEKKFVEVRSKSDGKAKGVKNSPKSEKITHKLVMNGTVEPSLLKLKTKKGLFNEIENNSSPIKGPDVKGKKKQKVPFHIDDSGETSVKNKKTANAKVSSSPEVMLGLELEKALSPKSKKEKKKLLRQKLGKTKVEKEIISSPGDNDESGKKKKRRRRRRSGKTAEASESSFCLFTETNVNNAVKALLKTAKSSQSEKKDFFGEDKCIYLQCNLLKGSEMSKAVLHVTLPHSILPETPEVCLLIPDLKGKRNDPDEAIDFYKDLLAKKGIDYVNEIVPIRKLKSEYTTFSQRRAMANRFDAIIVDGKVGRYARIGRRFAGTRKCVSSVKLDSEDWKTEFDKALRKIAVFCQGTGLSLSVKCGREGMPVNHIVENILTLGRHLANDKVVIGSARNVGSVYVKTALSDSFPVYVSTATPNQVSVPEGKKRKVEESVEDEVTTVMGATVVVHPSGNVRIKRQKRAEAEEPDQEPTTQDQKKKQKEKLPQKKLKQDVKVVKKENEEDDSDLESDFESTESNFDSASEEHDIKAEGSDLEGGSDEEDADESDEETSGLKGSFIDDEASEDDDSGDEETSNDEESGSDGEFASDSDDLEDKITEAEMEYLKEVREMQDSFAQKKKQIKQAKPPQVEQGARFEKRAQQKGDSKKPDRQTQSLIIPKEFNNKKKFDNKQKFNDKQGNKNKLNNKKFSPEGKIENKKFNQQKMPGSPQFNKQNPGKPQFNKQKPGSHQFNKQKPELSQQKKQENKKFIQQEPAVPKMPSSKVANQPLGKMSSKLHLNKEKAGGESKSHLMRKKPSLGGKKFKAN